MLQRCYDPNTNGYEYYGGRGITVCARWHDLLNFLADMGDRPEGMTLDRLDPNGNYEPGNCRWATAAEQQQSNKSLRPSRTRYFVDGVPMTMREMAATAGITTEQMNHRLNARKITDGMSAPRSLLAPFNHAKSLAGKRRYALKKQENA